MNSLNKVAQSQLFKTDTHEEAVSILEKGAALLSEGNLDQALIFFQQAMAESPDNPLAFYNAGVASHQLGRLDQAINFYTCALNKAPSLTQALYNLGIVHIQNNAPHKGIPFFLKVLEIRPDNVDALYNIGIAYERNGEKDKALQAYQQTLDVMPNHSKALNNIGLIVLDDNNIDDACTYFKQALTADPNLAEAHYNMGLALQCRGETEKARTYYHAALQADKHYAPAKWMFHLMLPSIYHTTEQVEAERIRFSRNLDKLIETTPLDTKNQINVAVRGVGATTNFFLPCHGRNDLNLQKRYGQFASKVMTAGFPNWSGPKKLPLPRKNDRIRIGYVTSLMYSHTVGDFLLGWVKHHNRHKFEIHCYHLGHKSDIITEHLEAHSDHFRQLPNTIENAAKSIEADDLHLLVYPEIGMCSRTLQLAAMRLAPIQCAGWWHPVTTGLPTMDYYLAGELIETDQAQQYYSEKLVLLPNISLCYTPPALPSTPKSKSQLGIPQNRFVYLSPQTLHKYLPKDDDIYPQIASKVPEALFVFISNKHDSITNAFKMRLDNNFKQYNLNYSEYCLFLPQLDHADFLSLNMCADLQLDTLEWSGGHTTIEAISCGLPVVTLPGRFLRGLTTYGMLKMMGIDTTIAKDKDDYCRIAVRMANDRLFHTEIKRRFKNRAHRLYKDQSFIHALENFYQSCLTNKYASDRDKKTQDLTPPLTSTSSNADHSHLINKAFCFLKQGRPDQAIAAFQKALNTLPDYTPFDHYYYLGIAFQQCGQLEKAAACYLQALELTPERDEIYLALGDCRKAQSDHQGAEACYRQVLLKNPNHPEAAFSLGTLYLQLNHIETALEWLHKANELKPDWSLLQNNMGNAYRLKGEDAKAFECLTKAARLDPNLPDAWFNLAEMDVKAGDYEQAILKYQKAIQFQPAMVAAHNNMANALKESKRYDEAIASFKDVLSQAPGLPQGHYNLGEVYRLVENFDKAIVHLSHAVQFKPDYAQAWNNLGLTYKNMGNLNGAMTHFNRALEIAPALAEARWNRSFVNFLRGNWLQGWQDFEARFDIPHWQTIYPHRIQGVPWDGSPIPAKTLLVHDEQGLGDTIQFARLLPWAKERCKHLILETREELVPLLQNNPAIDQIVVRSTTQPPTMHFDNYISLMSISRLAGISPQHPMGESPYITAETGKIDQWKNRLVKGKKRVGIVWAGRPQHGNDANRSLSITQLAPLFQNRDMEFIGLQKGPAEAQARAYQWSNVINIGPSLESFSDTAAVLAQLDLLITVDTAVAHLAGAMGRPVWVLIPFIPDWRWGMQGEWTPWYPQMRLFRQERLKAWEPVIDRINRQLQQCFSLPIH